MTTQSVKQRTAALTPKQTGVEMRMLLEAAQADIANLRAAVVALTAKLDADAGVTDADYAATCDPAALNLVA